ncbi:GNAT family N-acetyltransferase [Ketogulonicigenium robustum]|nr:GNAT family N-acetyltransferase [Ketogulonicigenium robustum]
MLVNLYARPLEGLAARVAGLAAQGITIRRALPPEMHLLQDWVATHFSAYWVSELTVAMAHQPPGCWIAVENGALVGFACHDATARGFFGPTGVSADHRGKGIGLGLLYHTLMAMRAQGHAYAIIGSVGPADFYAQTVGAMPIPADDAGIYQGLLRRPETTA